MFAVEKTAHKETEYVCVFVSKQNLNLKSQSYNI